jgi:hypothetical protein
MALGERVFAGLIGALGLFWIAQSLRLRYWADFAPGSGFLPLWLSVILVALVALFLVESFVRPAAASAPSDQPARPGRVVAILAGLVVSAAVFEQVGFAAAVGADLVFLLAVVERRSWLETVGVAGGTVLFLHLVFRTWLRVPLPAGPWGF